MGWTSGFPEITETEHALPLRQGNLQVGKHYSVDADSRRLIRVYTVCIQKFLLQGLTTVNVYINFLIQLYVVLTPYIYHTG